MLSTMDLTHDRPSSTERAQPGPRSLGAADTMARLMRHKQWADADLLAAALALPAFRRYCLAGTLAKVIRHFHAVDCIFQAHLLGVPHAYTSANPAEPATLAELQKHVGTIDAWYVAYAHSLDERALAETLDVTFTDGEQQRLTRSDILLHVSLHGAYHRGNAGILMRVGGAAPLPDRFTSYLRAEKHP